MIVPGDNVATPFQIEHIQKRDRQSDPDDVS
jgi:hypothetical protein